MSEYWAAAFLGIVQGLTEFLPVSSSGHLAITESSPILHEALSQLFSSINPLQFNIILHAGTLLAVLWYFRIDIFELTKNGFFLVSKKSHQVEEQNKRLIYAIILATVPAATVPLYKSYVEEATTSTFAVSIAFILNGLFLIFSESRRKNISSEDQANFVKPAVALLIGFFQCIAVFPGISRSGSTISIAMLLRVKPAEAVRFSFLISIPVMVAAILLEMKALITQEQLGASSIIPALLGALIAFFTGILSLKLLTWIGKKASFTPFGIYTLLLGLLLIITGDFS